jgi:nucleotide-binding universal stress UspA family protein
MKRILLAVGDTATSLQAARQIRAWLRERETSLTLMSVVEPDSLSLLSPVKHVLEQAEAVFTGAEEQPGILVRISSDPAAELCQQMRDGRYDLLAVGLRSQHRSDGTVGTTCRALLRTCPAPMFIVPPTLHMGMTSQMLMVIDRISLDGEMTHWLAAQCQAQRLNAILYTTLPEKAARASGLLASSGIRVQVINRSQLTTNDILAVGKDRRVRWIVLPIGIETRAFGSLDAIEELIGRATCPVLVVPSSSA